MNKEALGLLTNFIDIQANPIYILDSLFKITNCNSAAKAAIHGNFESILDIFPMSSDTLKECQAKKTACTIPSAKLTQNEEITYWDIHFSPFVAPDSEVFVATLNNVTEKINLKQLLFKNEKLTTLGILIAGIAHEINNPVNFVVANIEPLKKDISDLLTFVKVYQNIQTDSDLKSKLKEIEQIKTELDIEYALGEIPQLIEGIKEGSGRIAILVKDLKTFAKPDEKAIKKIDIHDLINSTLSLLTNSYKNRIEIVRNFGDFPPVSCVPGKMNQVFMNLLLNAIQAIENQGKVTIQTSNEEDKIKISIKDTGAGISEQNQKNLFKLFFTTKESSGTGLGLVITQSIIQEHHGSISVKSKLGEGTEFIILLPNQ